MNFDRSRIASAVSLFLMFAIAFSLIVIPAVNAQAYEIRITNYGTIALIDTDVQFRVEVRMDGSRIGHAWENVTLQVRSPGSSSWTVVGPFDPGDFDYTGRIYVYYTVTELGIYEFMFNVPAQLELPSNPATTDGSWYSEISETEVLLEYPPRTTYAYIGATPNPVGVGQETLLHIGITQQLTNVRMGWEDLSVTITKPDGTTETLSDIRTDATGGTGRVYMPTMVGNYTLQTHFPEQTTTANMQAGATPVGTRMLASDSRKLTLVVQEEPLPYYPGHPLPTEYWTRPIDAQLHEWNTISANWVTTPSNYLAPYNDDAPETAHILWAKQLETGGLAGGELGPQSFECGDAYEGKFSSSVVIAGVLYYNRYGSGFGGGWNQQGIVAVDLHTGEELWFKNNTRLSFGQVFYWDSYNYHGVFEYLWSTSGSTWTAYDAFTQEYMYTMEDVPSGTTIYGSKGEIYRINVDTRNGLMSLWNSSRVVSSQGSWGSAANTQRTFDATRGVEWTKTIPNDLPGSAYLYKLDDRVVGVDYSTLEVTVWGLSLKPGQEGTLLFKKTWKAPADWEEGGQSISRGSGSIDDGLITIWSKETQQNWGFSTETGEYLWGPTEPQNYLDFLGNRRFIAYGKFYSQGMSGILYCYDGKTGDLLWTYSADDPYNQVLWANDWSIRPVIVTDGKIYMGNSEHSPVDPKPRGGPFVCVNATTGEEIWRADGLFRQTDWGGRAVMGDSIIATMDTYDQRIYAIGKGPSATSVSVQNDVITHGSSVLVKGMVTDVSPGTEEYGLTARFPNGVPAVSDANMSEWMLYVYKQFERPADAVGVEVVVSVLDPNNNFYEVGRATSDSDGFFKLAFTPEVPGEYTIIASFEGSGAYYSSHAETAINVEEAPAATPEPTPMSTSTADLYLVPGIVGIIVAIVVVGAILMLMLRKR